MLSLSPPCEVNLIQNFGVLLLIFLLFSSLENQEENECGSAKAEDENAADSKRPCAVFTGHRGFKTLRVDHLQRSNRVLRTRIHLIFEHRDVIAVNRCRCSLIVVSKLRLRDVCELEFQTDVEVITRVVLHDAERIFAVNVARTGCVIHGLNRYVDVVFEERITVSRLELRPDVLVVFDALEDTLL